MILKGSRSLESPSRKSNGTVRLNIEKLVYGGYGLAREGSRVFLVRYAAPRELVDAEVLEEKKDYSYAQIRKIVIPSEVRRSPLCPHYGVCGGCQIQHIDYPAQVESKEAILLKVKNGHIGFFRPGEREVVDLEECPVLHRRINDLLGPLRECARHIRELQEIHVTYSPLEDRFLVKFVTPTEIDREFLKALKEDCLPPEVAGVGDYSRLRTVLNRRYWIGQEHLYMKAGRWRYRLGADSFFQVNYTLWEKFIEAVTGGVSFRKALDVHCGVGFFTIPLSEKGNFIEGSDSNGSAVNDAHYNAKLNSRSGLESGEVDLLIRNRPERIIYISCNPSTLARDLRQLLRGGYTLEGIRLVDMFPQTYHIESVSYLKLEQP